MVSRIDKMFGDFVAASLAIDGGGGNDGEVDVAPAPAPTVLGSKSVFWSQVSQTSARVAEP